MKTQFTKGPYTIGCNFKHNIQSYHIEKGGEILGMNQTNEEIFSNAALFNTAIELLEELRQTTHEIELMLSNESIEMNGGVREMLKNQIAANKDAIRKATEVQP